MKAYKIVQRNGTGYSSLCEQRYSVSYKVGEPTKPVIGKLLAFQTINDVVGFIWTYSAYYTCPVFECEVKNAEPITRLADPTNKSIADFWKKLECVDTMLAPHGTLACDEITLIREVFV